ncbi:MAG: hypothetical protein ORN49_06740 [Rhodobacteraceae bacterium]|nr:hypothetical protein [Paracoccaceae bacterium]
MTTQPRSFPDYAAALRTAYEEEVSGESYFARLAEFHPGRAAEALRLMARMERVTAAAVKPAIRRHAIPCTDPDQLRSEGRAEADRMAGWSWDRLVRDMRDNFAPYVTEFERLAARAPDADKPATRLLVDHERAIIRFAELDAAGDLESHTPLLAYLARFAGTAPAR